MLEHLLHKVNILQVVEQISKGEKMNYYDKRLKDIRVEELQKQIRYEKRNSKKWWSNAKVLLPKLQQELKELTK